MEEIQKHKDDRTVKTIETKIKNYNFLKTEAPETTALTKIREKFDSSDNDAIDTSLLKEVYAERVNCLITEDRGIHRKAAKLGISNLVFSIDSFLEKISAENPSLTDYNRLTWTPNLRNQLTC